MVDVLLRATSCHRGDEPLSAHLKRITECGVGILDISPKRLQELLQPVLEASHEPDSRQEIMRHLCGCLSEATGKRWNRIFGGMVLTEKLMNHGSHVLLIETAHGHHFDVVQKVSFLEHFDSAARGVTDKRAQKLVREKASELRTSLVPRLKKASSEELPQNAGLGIKDTISSCSYGCMSTTTASTATGSGAGSAVPSSAGSDVARSPATGECPTLVEGPEDEEIQRAVKYSNLQDAFQRITESGLIDIPEEFVKPIIEASHDAGSRQVILIYLQNCLSDQLATRQWRRVYCGLVVAYNLLEHGSPLLFIETPYGLNDYDLASEVYFLQFFEYRSDWRAQSLVRKKATELREKLIEWFQRRGIGTDLAATSDDNIDDAFIDLRSWVEAAENWPLSASSSRPSTEEECDDAFQKLTFEAVNGGGMPLRCSIACGASPTRKPGGDVALAPEEPDEVFFTPFPIQAEVGSPHDRPLHLLSL
jgi:hypothetical protein